MTRGLFLWLFSLVALTVSAFQEPPRESVDALGTTKVRQRIPTGLVFVEGKFVKPPYSVNRSGTCICINRNPVTGQIVDWNEFLKTQSGVKVTKSEAAATAPQPEGEASPASGEKSAPEPAAVVASSSDDDSSLDDLFDDDPKPKKKAAKKSAPPKPKDPPKPKATVSYSLEGKFVPNDQTKAMVKRINAVRRDIENLLRKGNLVFFSARYPRITGDSRTADVLLNTLPEILQSARSLDDFKNAVRSAQLYYLNDEICEELYRNRVSYCAMQKHRDDVKRDKAIEDMLNRPTGY